LALRRSQQTTRLGQRAATKVGRGKNREQQKKAKKEGHRRQESFDEALTNLAVAQNQAQLIGGGVKES